MATKIRLQRHGKKNSAYFHIVIADTRSPRDGRFIEKLGMYNPNTNPATIEIDFEQTLKWLQNGAQPSDTCKAILSYKGVLYKNHLLRGVTKGALTAEQAETKFAKWLTEKEAKISGKINKISTDKEVASKKRLAEESASKEKKAQAIAAKASTVTNEPVAAADPAIDQTAEATETAE